LTSKIAAAQLAARQRRKLEEQARQERERKQKRLNVQGEKPGDAALFNFLVKRKGGSLRQAGRPNVDADVDFKKFDAGYARRKSKL
jgi:phosphotransacetylase